MLESVDLLHILRPWFWLIGLLVLATVTVLVARLIFVAPAHESTVTVHTPSLWEEDQVAFIETPKTDHVPQQTVTNLGWDVEAIRYDLDVKTVPPLGFTDIPFWMHTPSLAMDVANNHVEMAIARSETLRIRPSCAERQLLIEQMGLAEVELSVAEDALAQLQVQHGIATLDAKLEDYESIIVQLQRPGTTWAC